MKGIGRIKIHPGKLDDYKRLARRCIDIVRARDTGTLQYEMVINEDAMTALVFEHYKDSAAGLKHAENVADISKELEEVCDISGEVWGDPSPELSEMLKSAGVTVYTPFASA